MKNIAPYVPGIALFLLLAAAYAKDQYRHAQCAERLCRDSAKRPVLLSAGQCVCMEHAL